MPEHGVAVKVFLADYSGTVSDSIAAMLAARGLNIVGQAATPQGAMDGILATEPDVVVLDTQLAGGDGLELLRAVRRTKPGIAFIVFSLHAGAALRLHYLGAGANCFLDKATEFGQLASSIRYISGPRPPAKATSHCGKETQ